MNTPTRPDVAELTKLASALQTDTVALAERTAKHDSEASAIARVREDLSKRAATFSKLASDSRAHTVKVLSQPQKATGNGHPKPVTAKVAAPVKAKGAKRKRNRRPKGPVKFIDPENPRNTWTGMGTVPNWIKVSGKPKEAFQVDQAASA